MIYISVVSHGHYDVIKNLGCLEAISQDTRFHITLRDNLRDTNLEEFSAKKNIDYVRNNQQHGFGKNNNLNFKKIASEATLDDYFLILNPDILVSPTKIVLLTELMMENGAAAGTINLFVDTENKRPDYNVRKFPKLITFVKSFAFGVNDSILEKQSLANVSFVDWAAGSFLLFRVSEFKKLNGFDESYFMYCEDIDLCWRYKKIDERGVLFARDIVGHHNAQHRNRSIFSRHFVWHIKSVLRFVFKSRVS